MARCVLTHREQFELTVPWRVAMPMPTPDGVTYHYHPDEADNPMVTARHNGDTVGFLRWFGKNDPANPGEVDNILVHPKYRGTGIATGLYDFARQNDPTVHHSQNRSPEGDAWVAHEQSREASLGAEIIAAWADDLTDYRTERHRQETELEKATGGYGADKADYFARGGQPLITYKDWMKGRKGWGGEAQPIDPDFHYTAPEGSDYEPPW